MAKIRFLHTADLHLSKPFGFLPPQLAEERRRDQRKTLSNIADLALQQDVNIILISGDLFDCPDPDPTDIEAVAAQFTKLGQAGIRIFAIPGNHDYIVQGSFWNFLNVEGLHVFMEAQWDSIVLDDLGIAVFGTAFDRSNSERRAFDGLDIPEGIPTIALVHSSYEIFEGLKRYHPFALPELEKSGATYAALGHYHRFNTFIGENQSACYPGSPEGLGFDQAETGDRFAVLGEISDDGNVKLEPIKVNHRTIVVEELDLRLYDSQSTLYDAVRKLCDSSALIQLKFKGRASADLEYVTAEIPERFKESALYINVDEAEVTLPLDLHPDDHSIHGRFCRRLSEQIEETQDPKRKKLLYKALSLGLEAFISK